LCIHFLLSFFFLPFLCYYLFSVIHCLLFFGFFVILFILGSILSSLNFSLLLSVFISFYFHFFCLNPFSIFQLPFFFLFVPLFLSLLLSSFFSFRFSLLDFVLYFSRFVISFYIFPYSSFCLTSCVSFSLHSSVLSFSFVSFLRSVNRQTTCATSTRRARPLFFVPNKMRLKASKARTETHRVAHSGVLWCTQRDCFLG
jgi:hypothetical protein